MISRLIEKIKITHAPVCVGLDPMLSYVPEHILKKSYETFGETWRGLPMPSGSLIRKLLTAPGI